MKEQRKLLLRVLVLLLLVAVSLVPLQAVLARKTLEPPWDNTNKIGGFYNEPAGEFEVVFYGSSHAFCSFIPTQLWKETGVKSYMFSTQQQPPWATYYYLKETFRLQDPSLVVVESRMFTSDQEYYADPVTYTYMDELPLSWDKVKLALVSAPDWETRVGLLFNFIKYHGRWNELTAIDFTLDRSKTRDPYKGFVLVESRQDEHFPNDISGVEEQTPLLEKNAYWLEQIIRLCEDEGVELWLVKSPANLTVEQKMLQNTVEAVAEAHGVTHIDFNEHYEQIGLEPGMFYDWHHLDAEGAVKMTTYFGKLLTQRRPDLKRVPEDAQWEADLEVLRRDIVDQYGEDLLP